MIDYITLSQIMGRLMRLLGDACLIGGVWLLVELGKGLKQAYSAEENRHG